MLATEPRATNDFLSKILEGPLRFKADSGYFRIEGEVSKSKALFGVPRFARPYVDEFRTALVEVARAA